MIKYLKQIWNSKDIRTRILFTLGILVIYRLIAQIPVPGANLQALQAISNQNQFLEMFSLLTGGSTENFSIVLMGISPYINASIIIQLLTVVIPKLENISKEGEQGRRKLNSYTRWLTLPLAFLQSYGMIVLLNSQAQLPIVSDVTNPGLMLPMMLTISAGTILLVWLGEQITEKGIGNGISMIIFAGIIAQIPPMVGSSLFLAKDNEAYLIPFLAMLLLTVALVVVVILFSEGERRVPITYAGKEAKSKATLSFFPIKLNQAGMIPIIFAVALISFPGIIGQFMVAAKSEWVRNFGEILNNLFQVNTLGYMAAYFILVIVFSFFYVSITFNSKQIAENIQKRGGYIPGIRPGTQTSEYLETTSRRLTFFGAIFLGIIAVLPIVLQNAFSNSGVSSVPMLISGAGIIIIVGVVTELIRQINAQMVMHDYGKFY